MPGERGRDRNLGCTGLAEQLADGSTAPSTQYLACIIVHQTCDKRAAMYATKISATMYIAGTAMRGSHNAMCIAPYRRTGYCTRCVLGTDVFGTRHRRHHHPEAANCRDSRLGPPFSVIAVA